ncbi:hypothetical protein [Mesorhizobium sp.]|uniref:hypothetical protein n=1 Tax=Mesorhizobium sp. TaxID=1871066 RepID=UPI000FE3D223|nr:hypothetical protein [Mesorhizobium sp.]RWG88435.1 MAG: hypothetical protein EOQ69_00425 [Mesorhizobium sp.]RWG91062.1 MAG: hypothetical protein EOQ70_01560 [Mesorhizobium sp.]RWK22042.1 MAG: hypothetical protein EOR41_01710 [Mesorhizobium sp.]TIQ51885.1 MAG: hypothetical protein E5X47_01565 [Mesorhizobium sp.]TIQ60527.1 MAG: hypothetical protein E5X46_01490 [Mesorhizobium sp.]
MPAPVLREIVRQHAEMAAFLWMVYDRHLLHPQENPELDEVRVARLVERLEAHLDGLRVAGDIGREIARQRYAEYPDPGELFVIRMLSVAEAPRVVDLDPTKVRAWISANQRRS